MKKASLLSLAVLLAAITPTQAVDQLSSWNDSAPKQAIVAFVEKVTKEGAATFVPVPERIAVFDNDGTLWAEEPVFFQAYFMESAIKAQASEHPEWKTQEPFASVLAGKIANVLGDDAAGAGKILAAVHARMTTDEFAETVRRWASTARHPQTGKLFTEMVYQPMLELMAYLRTNGFKTYIVSGGGIEFIRAWSERVYGVPPEQVIGSYGKLSYRVKDGVPTLFKEPEMAHFNDTVGKPVGIQTFIGRRPIAAFGNSDGDYGMLEWVTSGLGPRLGLYVHHDDAEREYAYDRDSPLAKLSKGLDDAPAKGWIINSMKRDWKKIYPLVTIPRGPLPLLQRSTRY